MFHTSMYVLYVLVSHYYYYYITLWDLLNIHTTFHENWSSRFGGVWHHIFFIVTSRFNIGNTTRKYCQKKKKKLHFNNFL